MSKRVTLSDREIEYIMALVNDAAVFDQDGGFSEAERYALGYKLTTEQVRSGFTDISRIWSAGEHQSQCRRDCKPVRREAA